MKQSLLLLLSIGLLAIGLAGCNDTSSSAPENTATEKAAPAAPEAAPAAPEAAPAAPEAAPAAPEAAPAAPEAAPAAPEAAPAASEAASDAAAGAAPGADGASQAIDRALLVHHRFLLRTADGVDYSAKERTPSLEFLEGFRVAGGVCNRFTGQGELEGTTLFVKQMASTKMLCVDQELNALEGTFAAMLEKGAELRFDGKVLTLRGDGHELVYDLRDLVQ